jgi:hypothetical protein
MSAHLICSSNTPVSQSCVPHSPCPLREICYYGDPHVRLRRFGGVGERLANMENQGIGHSLKRTRTLYYLVTSLIKTMDTHVVYIRYLSHSSRRSFLLFAEISLECSSRLLATAASPSSIAVVPPLTTTAGPRCST